MEESSPRATWTLLAPTLVRGVLALLARYEPVARSGRRFDWFVLPALESYPAGALPTPSPDLPQVGPPDFATAGLQDEQRLVEAIDASRGVVIARARTDNIWCPAVVTDCASGRAEVLENGARGRLVSVGEAAAMADARVEAFEQAVRRRAAARLGLEALIGVGG